MEDYYTGGTPTGGKPINPVAMAIVAVLIVCVAFVGFALMTPDLKEGKILKPGYHDVNKFPFLIIVKPDKVAIIRGATRVAYLVEYYSHVRIPMGHIGLVFRKGLKTNTLQPGKYMLDLGRDTVHLVKMEKQTFYFKGETP